MKDLSKKNVLAFFLMLFSLNFLVVNAQTGIEENDYFSIGLLVNTHNETAAVCSAEMAVKQINKDGGIKGKPLKLIIRSIEGSWGAGSSEVVDLVFKEKVVAILGSIDGRNSHLAEQVIAKTQVMYLSVWASDPSLSKAYVPWYFSLVPTDEQQAIFMLEELSVKKRFQKILVIKDQTYDAEKALKSLLAASNGFEDLSISSISYQSLGSNDLQISIENNKLDAIIVLGRQDSISGIMNQLQGYEKTIPVYTNLSAQGSKDYSLSQIEYKDQLREITSGSWAVSKENDFRKEYFKKCYVNPGPVAAYTYDGLMILSEAIKQSGNDLKDLQKIMSQINYQGVTGAIQFDSQGRLKNTGELLLIKE